MAILELNGTFSEELHIADCIMFVTRALINVSLLNILNSMWLFSKTGTVSILPRKLVCAIPVLKRLQHILAENFQKYKSSYFLKSA